MTHEDLRAAGESLRRASEATEDPDLRERLDDKADRLEAFADRPRGPDHGQMARIQAHLREIRDDADGALDEYIDEANDHVNAYRETVEGV